MTRYDVIHIVIYIAIGVCMSAAGIDFGDWQRYAILALILAADVTSWLEGRAS
jgi:hypothetical protein